MAGIALILDLLRKNPSFSGQALHSHGSFSATFAASAAAAYTAACVPFASRALFGNAGTPVAYCDAGATITDDYISSIRTASGNIFWHDSLKYSTKEYNIELKPLFSAFCLKSFALTSLRSFLVSYLPLLEPRANMEEDDDNFLQDTQEEHHIDLVVPFKKSVKLIVRETTVVTTRRVLERLAVHTSRSGWRGNFLKVPKSAMRKAERGIPTSVYCFRVSRTTLRGHFLAVAATWLVQVGIDVYLFFSSICKPNEEIERVDKAELFTILGKKVCLTTVKCVASLVFASIGAGVGATLFRPYSGQFIGCALGDLAGPTLVAFCLEKLLHRDS